jgi:hypothetical protein
MGIYKVTVDRIAHLVQLIKTELQGYQIGKFAKEPEVGVVDLPMFGIRFKCTHTAYPDDSKFRVISVTVDEELNKDELFLELVASGYLKWIRSRYSSHGYFTLLSYDKRGEKILKAAKVRAKENKKGEFRLAYLNNLLKRPFIEVYQEDPTVFDWILL